MELVFKLVWILLVYIIGSIPFGLVLGLVFCKIDIRKAGSGNVGATNVARLCGFKLGVLALFLDALKGAAPVALALYVFPNYFPTLVPAKTLVSFVGFTALAAILGHIYSYFLKFRGGKAVATTVGVYLVLLPIHLLIAAVLCILVIKRWGYVSLGSITLVAAMPVLLIFSGMFTRNFEYMLLSVCILVLVLYSHRGNLGRLMAGEEKPWQKRGPAEETIPAPAASTLQDAVKPAPQPSDAAENFSSANACPPIEDQTRQGLKGI